MREKVRTMTYLVVKMKHRSMLTRSLLDVIWRVIVVVVVVNSYHFLVDLLIFLLVLVLLLLLLLTYFVCLGSHCCLCCDPNSFVVVWVSTIDRVHAMRR